jgi:hypothetical protein
VAKVLAFVVRFLRGFNTMALKKQLQWMFVGYEDLNGPPLEELEVKKQGLCHHIFIKKSKVTSLCQNDMFFEYSFAYFIVIIYILKNYTN